MMPFCKEELCKTCTKRRFFDTSGMLIFTVYHIFRKNASRKRNKMSNEKRKSNPEWVAFFLVAEMGFEPHDLRVMSPTSYQAALLRDIYSVPWCRWPGSNRYDALASRDFKSRASACSATPAGNTKRLASFRFALLIIAHTMPFVNPFLKKLFFFLRFSFDILCQTRISPSFSTFSCKTEKSVL